MAHDNAVLRHIVAKIVFPGGSDRQETTILERNTSFSDRETLEQSCWHSNCPFTVDKLSTHPDRSRNSWQPSRDLVSVLRSLVSCTLPRLLSFLGRPLGPCMTSLSQSNLVGPPTFWRRERELNRPFTIPTFPGWRKMVWERRILRPCNWIRGVVRGLGFC